MVYEFFLKKMVNGLFCVTMQANAPGGEPFCNDDGQINFLVEPKKHEIVMAETMRNLLIERLKKHFPEKMEISKSRSFKIENSGRRSGCISVSVYVFPYKKTDEEVEKILRKELFI